MHHAQLLTTQRGQWEQAGRVTLVEQTRNPPTGVLFAAFRARLLRHPAEDARQVLAPRYAELAVGVLKLVVDGARGDHEPVGDLAAARTGGRRAGRSRVPGASGRPPPVRTCGRARAHRNIS